MSTISNGVVHVFTFKTGVLSRVAHDLRFTLGRFEIQVENAGASTVRGRFWPDSLQVDGVMRSGRLESDTLRAADKAEIVSNVRSKILHTSTYPEAVLEARLIRSPDRVRCEGVLELVGQRQSVAFDVHEDGASELTGEVEIQPTRWGIPPFKALLGAIQLQDRVLIRFQLPRSA